MKKNILNNIKLRLNKLRDHKIVRVLWYILLIYIACYVIVLVLIERKHEWESSYEFVLQGDKYVLADKKYKNIKKPNILTFELSKLKATHGEILADGSISISFYNPEKYPLKLSDSGKNKIIALEVANIKEAKEYPRIPAQISCEEGTDDAGKYLSGFTDTVFVPIEGHIYDYPFDNMQFSFAVRFQPTIIFDKIHFYNRVHGMFLEAKPRITNQKFGLSVTFETVRKNSIKIAYWIILFSIVVYIILILFFVQKLNSLVSAVGGFFISVWSIRALFSEGALIYPNLVDLTVIFSSIVLLVGILDRIIFNKYSKNE